MKSSALSPRMVFLIAAGAFSMVFLRPVLAGRELADGEATASDLTLEWNKDILKIKSPRLPGGELDIWYLEAFCRRGSSNRDWEKTVIPHVSRLLRARQDGKELELKTLVDGKVRVRHLIRVVSDGVEFRLTLENLTGEPAELDWAQPCVRVGSFTGLDQDAYIRKCFIFTERGLTTLDRTRRTTEALYRGGQVYVPKGIDLEDVNPRPISPDVPANGLIGCFSREGELLLATAWKPTQELFQGVIVCIHNDFRIGGLAPRETKTVHGKVYILRNDIGELLRHYRNDFGD